MGHVLSHGLLGQVFLKLRAAAQEVVRVEVTQRQVGVGDRRELAPLAVGSWAGQGTGALRAHFHDAAGPNRGDAAAAGAHGVDIDHRDRYLPTALEFLGAEMGFSILDQGDVGAGAAHVKGNYVGGANQAPVGGRAADPAGGSRQYGAHRQPV